MGRLLVLEGGDASGKSTQFEMLCYRISREDIPFRAVSFPRYEDPSSYLLRQYLDGAFGFSPDSVGPYAASTLFAVDRFASFQQDWGPYYAAGGLVLAYRYTTSNAIYHAAKLPPDQWEAFYTWLFDFEYRLLSLPAPDAVIYLDMPPDFARELLRARGDSDIHERDEAYRARCYEAAAHAVARFGWRRVDCAPQGNLRSIEDINEEIYGLVQHYFSVET